MDKHEVLLSPTQAHAFLGNSSVFHTFRFNPDAVSWNYQENTISTDTIGGRVVQLLSVQIQGMNVVGRAGSRAELQRLSTNIKDIMSYQVNTQRAVQFKVPSRHWNFLVYVAGMPQAGWDVATTSYPYQLSLAVEEDLTGVHAQRLEKAVLGRLADGIGYDPKVHGGDVGGFTKVVDSILSAKGATSSGSDGGDETSGPSATGGGGFTSIEGVGAATPAIKTVWYAVHNQFPRVGNAGICNVKTIVGSPGTYSQHSYANAWDVTAPGGLSSSPSSQAFLDELVKWLMQNIGGKGLNLPIDQILWRFKDQIHGGSVYDHDNHVHITGNPQRSSGFCE